MLTSGVPNEQLPATVDEHAAVRLLGSSLVGRAKAPAPKVSASMHVSAQFLYPNVYLQYVYWLLVG